MRAENLNHLRAEVKADNARHASCMQAAGFQETGLLARLLRARCGWRCDFPHEHLTTSVA